MVVAGGPATEGPAAWPDLPGDATYAVDVVQCPDAVRPALTHLLDRVAVVDDLTAARRLVADSARTDRGDARG